MKTIPLTRGFETVVDDDVFEKIGGQKWCASTSPEKNNVYARGTVGGKGVFLHQFVMGFPKGVIDHVNLNSLDNRRENLRVVTDTQNKWNTRKPRHGLTSKFKGVRFHHLRNKWTAQLSVNGKAKYIGIFATEEAAAHAYNETAKKLRGEFARVNAVPAKQTARECRVLEITKVEPKDS